MLTSIHEHPQSFIEDRCVKIPWSGCWIWEGATQMGYGSFRATWKGSTQAAHRKAYEAFKGPIPKGLWVLHECDIRSCCNPAHLFLGTRQDNIADAVKKGRLKGIKRNHPSGLIYRKSK